MISGLTSLNEKVLPTGSHSEICFKQKDSIDVLGFFGNFSLLSYSSLQNCFFVYSKCLNLKDFQFCWLGFLKMNKQ